MKDIIVLTLLIVVGFIVVYPFLFAFRKMKGER